MRKITQILRLRFEGRLSQELIAKSLGLSRGAVIRTLGRFEKSGISFPLELHWNEQSLHQRLYNTPQSICTQNQKEVMNSRYPDWAALNHELKSNKHLTKMNLWEEYKESQSDGICYSQFCDLFNRYCKTLPIVYRNSYKGGETTMVDYSGDSLPIYPKGQSEPQKTEFVVFSWGASSFTYWEFTHSQKTDDFLYSHDRAFAYFECCCNKLICDNAKVAVTKACRYEPQVSVQYNYLAEHYGFSVTPARPCSPRDKGKEEAHVRFAQRWVLGTLRKRRFESLEDLNKEARRLLDLFNDKVMRKYGKSRRELFLELDKPNALPLPKSPYGLTRWRDSVRAGQDYHVNIDGMYYSVPFELRGKELQVKLTPYTVEIFYGLQSIAVQARLTSKGHYETKSEHMPKSHKKYSETTWSDIVEWACSIGPQTSAVCEAIQGRSNHPVSAYRAALGVVRLEKWAGKERMERACEVAIQFHQPSYRDVKRILTNGWDRAPLKDQGERPSVGEHENIRGAEAFSKGGSL